MTNSTTGAARPRLRRARPHRRSGATASWGASGSSTDRPRPAEGGRRPPNTLVMSGTAGLGLSRLPPRRGAVGALAEPFAAVHGIALPATSGVPYAPVTAALEHLLEPLPDETLTSLVGPTGDAIARLVPRLRTASRSWSCCPPAAVAATEWREARMFEAVLGLLERLGERQPVALLLEDLHHADAATRGLVTFLARVSRGQRMMLIATYQPDRLLRFDPLRATLATLATTPSSSRRAGSA